MAQVMRSHLPPFEGYEAHFIDGDTEDAKGQVPNVLQLTSKIAKMHTGAHAFISRSQRV